MNLIANIEYFLLPSALFLLVAVLTGIWIVRAKEVGGKISNSTLPKIPELIIPKTPEQIEQEHETYLVHREKLLAAGWYEERPGVFLMPARFPFRRDN